MKIEIAAAALRTALLGFSKVISNRSSLPILGHLLLRGGPDSTMLIGTNLDDYLVHHLPEPRASEPLETLVPYEPLSRMVRDCGRTDQIVFEVRAGRLSIGCTVNGGMISQSFTAPAVAEFPPVPTDPHAQVEVVSPEFKAALLQSMECVSADTSRAVLQNVFIDVEDPSAHYVVGTDGRQLFSANSFKLGWKESLLIPRRKFLTWSGFSGPWSIGLIKVQENRYVQVGSPEWTLITRASEGPYPHWKQVVPTEEGPTRVSLDLGAVEITKAALKRLPLDPSNTVRLSVSAGSPLILSVVSPEQRASFPVTGARVTGPELEIVVNREYLLRALSFGLNEWQMQSPSKPLVCEQGGRRMLIMPVVIKSPDHPASSPASPTQPRPEPEPRINPSDDQSVEASTKEETMQTRNTNQTLKTARDQSTAPMPSENPTPQSAFNLLGIKIESARASLRSASADLNEALTAIKAAEKEKRTSERDLHTVRSTLRSLQKVQL